VVHDQKLEVKLMAGFGAVLCLTLGVIIAATYRAGAGHKDALVIQRSTLRGRRRRDPHMGALG
jgi:hypothetical protein